MAPGLSRPRVRKFLRVPSIQFSFKADLIGGNVHSIQRPLSVFDARIREKREPVESKSDQGTVIELVTGVGQKSINHEKPLLDRAISYFLYVDSTDDDDVDVAALSSVDVALTGCKCDGS